MSLMKKRTFIALILALVIVGSPFTVEARFLYHATKRLGAKKIMARGFSLQKMNPKGRFGKGVYLSESKKLALKERPSARAVVRFKDTKLLRNNSLSTRDLTKKELKIFSGDRSLRGNIHKGIIGGDLGKKTGKAAGRYGMVITYPSARGRGFNTFIPKQVYKEHPKIVRPTGMKKIGR